MGVALMGWRPPPRHMTDSNWFSRDFGSRKGVWIALGILAMSAVILVVTRAFDVRVNWTESMPRGVYQRTDPALERGAWVAVCLEGKAAQLARERAYVIDGSCASGLTPVLKRIVGIPGDRIDLAIDGVAVNGAPLPDSALKEVDSRGRPLERAAEEEFVLPEGRYFVMGMNPSRSWDSRYFGAVSEHQIVAGARPLWTF